jgi:hypothetical protein
VKKCTKKLTFQGEEKFVCEGGQLDISIENNFVVRKQKSAQQSFSAIEFET